MPNDVPSPIDFHDASQARAWVEDTIARRPYRAQFFAAFVDALNARCGKAISVLELGSGPGHLAEHILKSCDVAHYVALDFFAAMHDLAQERLAPFLKIVKFARRDFRDANWTDGLGKFDAIVTMQSAHETRHKSKLLGLLSRAKTCLTPQGVLFYSDHYYEEGPYKNPELIATTEEQLAALLQAGFVHIKKLLDTNGMALYAAK